MIIVARSHKDHALQWLRLPEMRKWITVFGFAAMIFCGAERHESTDALSSISSRDVIVVRGKPSLGAGAGKADDHGTKAEDHAAEEDGWLEASTV